MMPPSRQKKSDQPPPLLTFSDVARLDNCSEKTVRRAIRAGLLKAVRIGPGGRLLRIDPADHAAYRTGSSYLIRASASPEQSFFGFPGEPELTIEDDQ